jgi:molybdate transport system substrate-binding protein
MSGRSKRVIATGAVAAAVVAGCASHAGATTSITVFASSSLIKTFTDIGKRFKSDNPGTSVEFIFASSSDLAAQLEEGASADVFAAGDPANMAAVSHAGLVAGSPVNFASNTLAIAVAQGNPKRVSSFADLNQPGLRVALCARPGACAADTERIEDNTGIQLHPASLESSATDVLNKVTSGKADAGLVYTTDALNAGDNVTWFNFPEASSARNTYSAALLKDSDHAALAAKFINLVTGAACRQILSKAGFIEQ